MTGGKPIAIVVDDNAIIRMDACSILEDAGYDAHEAGDADEAVATIRRLDGLVDVLFTDVDMPGSSMDGFALARFAAKHWPHLALVVCSGRVKPGPDDLPKSAEFIGKPFSAEIIQDKLRQLLPQERLPPPLKD